MLPAKMEKVNRRKTMKDHLVLKIGGRYYLISEMTAWRLYSADISPEFNEIKLENVSLPNIHWIGTREEFDNSFIV